MDYEGVFTKRSSFSCVPLGEVDSPKGVTTYTKEIAPNSTGDVQSQIYLQSHWITANSYRNANNMRVVRLICTSFFSMVWKIYNLSFIFFNFCVFFSFNIILCATNVTRHSCKNAFRITYLKGIWIDGLWGCFHKTFLIFLCTPWGSRFSQGGNNLHKRNCT